jgi:hypothetical protein
MALPNFENRMSQKYTLTKRLEDLVSNYYVLHPKVKFVANKSSRMYDENQIGTLSAYQDSQYLGRIRVIHEDYRGLGMMDVYHISSDNINKRRGKERSTIKTKDAHKAIKVMEEVFLPPPASALKSKVISEVNNCIHTMISTARYKVFQETDKAKNSIDIAIFLLGCYEGNQPKIEGDLAKMFSTSDKIQNFYDLRIADSIGKEVDKGGAVVVEFSDETMWYTQISADSPEIVKLNSTYDMPQNFQEKLALIKLCEPSQPVEDVGVMFKGINVEQDAGVTLYYLVGGDTVTTC